MGVKKNSFIVRRSPEGGKNINFQIKVRHTGYPNDGREKNLYPRQVDNYNCAIVLHKARGEIV